MRCVGAKLPDTLYEEVVRRAGEEGVTVSELVRRAVESYLGVPPTSVRPQPPPADLQDLVGKVSELAEVVDKLASGLHQLAERVAEVERRLPAQQAGSAEGPSSGSSATANSGSASAKPRRTAMDILREQRFILEPEASHLKNRDAFFGKLRSGGAVVIETAKGRVAVLPEVWEDFRSRLSRVGTSREDAVKGTLGGELFKLFKFLREAGEVYYDSTASSWRFVEEAGEE